MGWRDSAGEVHLLDGRCIHKRFPLARGRLLENGTLECAYHGFCYDAEGRCVRVPSLEGGHPQLDRIRRLRRYPAVEQDGFVWAWPGPAEPGSGPPRTPEAGGGDWRSCRSGPYRLEADARLLIENLLDLTHFYPLHAGNIGTYQDAAVPVEVAQNDLGAGPLLTCTRSRRSFRFGPTKARWFGTSVGDNVAVHEMVSPGLFRVVERGAPTGRLGSEAERSFVLYQAITPVREGVLEWRRVVCSTHPCASPEGGSRSLAEQVAFDCEEVVAQDAWALEEQQKMLAFPDAGFREVHVRSDAPVLAARRLLKQLEAAEEELDAEPATHEAQAARCRGC